MHVELIEQCEILIQAGNLDAAYKKLNALNPAHVPRPERLALAGQCRRVGLINVGLRLLTSIVHPAKGVWGEEATPFELAEHAMLLHKSGAVREALSTLARADATATSEIYLGRSQCHMALGEFLEAAANLELYQRQADISPLQKLSSRVLLAAASIAADRWDYARHLLDETITAATHAGFDLVLGQALELRGRAHLQAGRFADARADLAGSGADPFTLHKWSTIIHAIESGDRNILLELRREAFDKKNWEGVRDADRFQLKIEFNEERFNWLLFGTPYSAFRASVEAEHGRLPERKELILGDEQAPALDLVTGEITGPMICPAPPRLVHRLVNALLGDFYRPIPTAGLFAELFPGEHFDVFSSIHRVHQAIHRTRKWFEANGIPIVIVETQGHYSLTVHGHFAIRVPYERQCLDAEARRFQALLNHFGGKGFTARQARQALGLTPAVFKSLMSWAEETGNVSRLGAGPSTRYRITAASKSA